MKREESVDYNIKATWHAIYRMYNQQALKNNITTSIGFVLLNIDSEKGTQATKIAPLLGLEIRSLTRMLKNLEEKKLIYKEPDAVDKRSIRIFLTEEGKLKKEISRKTVITFNKAIQNHIPQEKLKVFFEVLQNINKLLDEKKIYK